MKIRITPGALLLLPVLASEQGTLFWATLLAAALHECGHLLAAKCLCIPLRLLEIDLMGAKIYPARTISSYGAEVLLAGAGPLVSLLAVLPTLFLASPFAQAFGTATLSFALFNLLPIADFDGGRVLSGLITAVWGVQSAERVLFFSTYLSLLLLFSLSACLLLRYGESGTLAILSASLFARLFLSLDGAGSGRYKKARIQENSGEYERICEFFQEKP